MLGALKAYLKNDKDLPRTGGAGLQVWLRAERYDHWIDGPTCSVLAETLTHDGERVRFSDESIRVAAVASCGEAWVRSYLDPCELHPDRFITPKTGFALGKLKEKARELKAAGVMGIRPKA